MRGRLYRDVFASIYDGGAKRWVYKLRLRWLYAKALRTGRRVWDV